MYIEREYYPKEKVECEIAYTTPKSARRRRVASKKEKHTHVKIKMEGTLSDFQKVITDFSKVLKKPDDQERKGVQLEDICVFHWLNCLYQDYLDGAVVGTDNPCNSCPELGRCNVSAITNFNVAGEKYGLKVGKKENQISRE